MKRILSDFAMSAIFSAAILLFLPLSANAISLIGDTVRVDIEGISAVDLVATTGPVAEHTFWGTSDEHIDVNIYENSIDVTFMDGTGFWFWQDARNDPFHIIFSSLDWGQAINSIIVNGDMFGETVTASVLSDTSFIAYFPQTADLTVALGSNSVSLQLSTQLTPVPEPATLTLLAAGFGGLAAVRRRKQQ